MEKLHYPDDVTQRIICRPSYSWKPWEIVWTAVVNWHEHEYLKPSKPECVKLKISNSWSGMIRMVETLKYDSYLKAKTHNGCQMHIQWFALKFCHSVGRTDAVCEFVLMNIAYWFVNHERFKCIATQREEIIELNHATNKCN